MNRRSAEDRPSASGGQTVRLTIRGSQTDPDGHTQESAAAYQAVWLPAEDGHLFRYTENGEESELFVSRRLVRLLRRGNGETQMLFDPSVPSAGSVYRTPFGGIPMEIRTERIAVLDGRDKSPGRACRVQARIRYTLCLDADYCLQCTVTIRAESA